MSRSRRIAAAAMAALSLTVTLPVRADPPATMPATAPAAAPPAVEPIKFTTETLANGLRVIYAPVPGAGPVAQVRVLYHVGSRDERPDRQGFAHMFEHMMFRGSRHVKPEEHMRLVDTVGGICNAFTSFDQTVYHDTVPAEDVGLALYLEADRMASFKVTDETFAIERKVVSEEWRNQQRRPYGNLGVELFKTVFPGSSYSWTPIGNMQHLLNAPSADLQEFFNTYYVPNNAVLVVAGDVDPAKVRPMVEKYFGWIPKGGDVPHPHAGDTPEQTAPKSATLADPLARLTNVVLAYKTPPYKSDEKYALDVLGTILGGGSSGRIDRALVDTRMCVQAGAGSSTLEYAGLFELTGVCLPGTDPADVQRVLTEQVADVLANGVTPAELAKAKTANRVGTIRGRQTCDEIAGQVGDEALWADDPTRVNTDLAKLDAVTAADVQAVARKYLKPEQMSVVMVTPDPTGLTARKQASAAADELKKGAPVAAATRAVAPRDVQFPADYPDRPPVPPAGLSVHFDHGTEQTVNGVRVITLTDHRLPLVNWTLCMRRGSDSDPKGKDGLAGLTAAMLTHGAGTRSYQQLTDELDKHGISLSVGPAGDNTRLSGASTTDELDRTVALARDVLHAPTFPPAEFAKLKTRAVAGLVQRLATPAAAGGRRMSELLYGDTPQGRESTPATLSAITLDDVKAFYDTYYRPDDAVMTVSGDVTPEKAAELAKQLTDGWQPKPMPAVSYDAPPTTQPTAAASGAGGKRQVVLIDHPDASPEAGSIAMMGVRAYDVHAEPDKFAGSLANTLLSSGIESRLMEYVRAKKGYVYGITGSFGPGRHGGAFEVNAPTRAPVTGDCVAATFKVLDDLRNPAGENPLTDAQLADAKRRVTGLQVMSMQTVSQQAGMRLDGILNGYPIDYYDTYAEHINAVTADQVRAVMDKYAKNDAMTIVVVAPAAVVKPQLEQFGPVSVEPMPAGGGGGMREMMKPSK